MSVQVCFHGFMPRKNPILGTFQHAPSAKNARSKYFKEEVVSQSEYERMKALRHNPFTGQFHSGPRQFSNLHGLSRFRAGSEGSEFIKGFPECDEEFPQELLVLEAKGSDGESPIEEEKLVHNESIHNVEKQQNDMASLASSTESSSTTTELSSEEDGIEQKDEDNEEALPASPPLKSFGHLFSEAGTPGVIHTRERSYTADTNPLDFVRRVNSESPNIANSWDGVEFDWRPPFEEPQSPPTRRNRCHSSEHTYGSSSAKFFGFDRVVRSLTTALQHRKRGLSTSSQSKRLARSNVKYQRYFRRYATSEGKMTVPSPSRPDFGGSSSSSSSLSSSSLSRESSTITARTSVSASALSSSGSGMSFAFLDTSVSERFEDSERENPWLVNRTEEVTGKYKIDMSKAGSLGKGAYSLAKVAYNRQSGASFCVKIVKKRMLVTYEEKEMIKREVEIHQVLQHQHIIRLHEIFEDEKRLFLVMEKASGGSLEHHLGENGGCLPEAHCQHLFKQLLQAIDYLHENGVLQGDLKPANILLNKVEIDDKEKPTFCAWQVKLCDFGLSRKVPDVKYYRVTGDVHKVPFTSLCGTMGYVAPEILNQESYTIAADIWSAGIILYEMLGGIRPFVPYKDCLAVPLTFPDLVFGSISCAATALVSKMLALDVTSRITARGALCDCWLENSIPTLFSGPSLER